MIEGTIIISFIIHSHWTIWAVKGCSSHRHISGTITNVLPDRAVIVLCVCTWTFIAPNISATSFSNICNCEDLSLRGFYELLKCKWLLTFRSVQLSSYSISLDCLLLKMEALRTSEMLLIVYQSTWPSIAEGFILHRHLCTNLKSRDWIRVFY